MALDLGWKKIAPIDEEGDNYCSTIGAAVTKIRWFTLDLYLQ
ncbi:hypothetical protein ACFSYB_14795 [Litchfieldia salsa]